MNRAYSTFALKSFDESSGEFEGMASTPTVDRMGDIVEPKGAQFSLPLPLLWQHKAAEPIGLITAARITKDGISVSGKVMKDLLPRIGEVWTMIRAGMVRGLSIGFQSIESEPITKGEPWGPQRFTKWDWLELSAVTIPANAQANIQTIKSIDAPFLSAASGISEDGPRAKGKSPAGASAPSKGSSMKTIKDRIADAEAERASLAARMKELDDGCGGDLSSLEPDEQKELDEATTRVEELNVELRRYKGMQAAVATAVPVTPEDGADPVKATATRRHARIEMGKSNLPKGIGFARLAMSLMATKGSRWDAIQYAKSQPGWRDTSPEVISCLETNAYQAVIKAAVDVGVATSSTANDSWASPLVQYQNLASEFVELLRPSTIVGRINGMHNVPFNVKIPRETAAASAKWVGEAAPKPVGKFDYDTITLTWSKIALIVAMSDELVRFSNPSAEALVRDGLIKQITKFQDEQFIDPSVTAGATNPASITQAASSNNSTGSTIAQIKADLATMFGEFDAIGLEPVAPVFVMRPKTARYLSTLVTANDVPVFPNISAIGGSLQGVPVVTSGSVPSVTAGTFIVLADADQILLADDGQVSLDTSNQASIEMDDSPSGGAQSLLSLWQNNLVGIRAERYIRWAMRRDGGVTILEQVGY